MNKIDWEKPAIIDRIRFLEKMTKKLQMIILENNPKWKPSKEDIEEGLTTEELCKVAMK